MSRSAKIWQGRATDLPIQCYVRPTGSVPAVFSADDALTAAVYQSKVSTPVFTPEVGWYTRFGAQTGYDQGQVLVRIPAAQSALLQPTITYTLAVARTLASDPDNPEEIASIPLVIRNVNAS